MKIHKPYNSILCKGKVDSFPYEKQLVLQWAEQNRMILPISAKMFLSHVHTQLDFLKGTD